MICRRDVSHTGGMMSGKLKAPFPYFGGKSCIADKVWALLGEPDHYLEPFFGSGSVLLARAGWHGKTETVNDKDGFIANVWRALQFATDEVARWCDWPVNHADLSARRKILIAEEGELLRKLTDDPEWCDPKLAGYWIWGFSCWIGSGFTKRRKSEADICQRPHLSDSGVGVHCKKSYDIYEWFAALSDRLRTVRVVCGDWRRICGGNWQSRQGPVVGYYFDPPYGVLDRNDCYHCDSMAVATDVMEWCAEKGEKRNWRIVLSGYEEYQELVDNHGWGYESWKTRGGYSNSSSRENINRFRERLYYSPGCLRQEQRMLF